MLSSHRHDAPLFLIQVLICLRVRNKEKQIKSTKIHRLLQCIEVSVNVITMSVKRKVLSVSKKLEILRKYDENSTFTQNQLSDSLGIPSSTLRMIIKNRDSITTAAMSGGMCNITSGPNMEENRHHGQQSGNGTENLWRLGVCCGKRAVGGQSASVEDIERVQGAFVRSPCKPIRIAAKDFNLLRLTVHKVLHKNLRLIPRTPAGDAWRDECGCLLETWARRVWSAVVGLGMRHQRVDFTNCPYWVEQDHVRNISGDIADEVDKTETHQNDNNDGWSGHLSQSDYDTVTEEVEESDAEDHLNEEMAYL
ncbi:hypothetical protein ANN_20967 [Periplaneta americana]|uniref:HTH psq-type domain-containing protein n=1 Tax=Periplaneta americana TaxID=6978 RepID=A0ABQ8SED3_PERAM|nr:hypothetical protein ANN_20967 [Periplaneta americana]